MMDHIVTNPGVTTTEHQSAPLNAESDKNVQAGTPEDEKRAGNLANRSGRFISKPISYVLDLFRDVKRRTQAAERGSGIGSATNVVRPELQSFHCARRAVSRSPISPRSKPDPCNKATKSNSSSYKETEASGDSRQNLRNRLRGKFFWRAKCAPVLTDKMSAITFSRDEQGRMVHLSVYDADDRETTADVMEWYKLKHLASYKKTMEGQRGSDAWLRVATRKKEMPYFNYFNDDGYPNFALTQRLSKFRLRDIQKAAEVPGSKKTEPTEIQERNWKLFQKRMDATNESSQSLPFIECLGSQDLSSESECWREPSTSESENCSWTKPDHSRAVVVPERSLMLCIAGIFRRFKCKSAKVSSLPPSQIKDSESAKNPFGIGKKLNGFKIPRESFRKRSRFLFRKKRCNKQY